MSNFGERTSIGKLWCSRTPKGAEVQTELVDSETKRDAAGLRNQGRLEGIVKNQRNIVTDTHVYRLSVLQVVYRV